LFSFLWWKKESGFLRVEESKKVRLPKKLEAEIKEESNMEVLSFFAIGYQKATKAGDQNFKTIYDYVLQS